MDGEDWDANFIAQFVDGDGVHGDEAGDNDMDVDEEHVHWYDRFSHVIKELMRLNFFRRRSWVFSRSQCCQLCSGYGCICSHYIHETDHSAGLSCAPAFC